MKEIHFRLRNINNDDYQSIKDIALQHTGSSSPSRLARHLILQKLMEKQKSAVDFKHDERTNRLEIRLPDDAIEKLNVEAAEQSMSLNQYIRLLLITHLAKEPVPTTKEVQALRDSNYQLHKLGVNINQVAKAINSGTATSLTLKELQNISDTIDNHFGKVGTLLQAARRRI